MSAGNKKAAAMRRSTLMAIGALLGVETVRRHAEHLIALDADTMNQAIGGARRGAVLVRLVRRCLSWVAHGAIF
jgi:hypothetical protein